ncbi:hypothetical protein FC50_GL000546 [Lacticaseibacillus pantheris DSM 15945 = JCM 12539 = NBRC 106106]|uniref:Uncharacterized protein n=1 Tax=Lacticaseibacillus pantheris DSM 15945 = JCM 12539 = NBRC 106106 TaxID=1423783 RepID=A0A0R1U2A0_9LACO|nr:hypothetical protein [Lacticaseibacillus pantheris]KRL86724.1 hypothetical protein FC50_GL000546 [Lacticaseibacillus pantheris DSM 15945 = JCM 12539 = NBRC 106106]
MPSARDRILSTIALAGLSITYPILAGGTGGFVWSFQLVALVILAVVIAAVQLDWRPGWLAIVGIIPAIIGAFNQWTILPLALALLGLTYIISTQTMLHEIRTTLLIVLAGFTQIMLTMADTHVLQSSYLTALILMLIPFVVGVWSKYLPMWATSLAIFIICIAGFMLQHLTIIVVVAIMVLALVPLRRRRDWWSAYWLAAAWVTSILMTVSFIHG